MGRELTSVKSEFAEMESVDYSDSELVCYVRDALKLVTLGDMGSYEQLRKVIHHNRCLAPDEVALLVTSLKALSGAVSYIDSAHHGTLLDSIFQMKLWDYGPDVMDAIVDLIISLAAASGKHIDSCLSMLVGNFVPPDSFLRLLKLPRGDERKGQVVDHIHTALQKITELVPVSPMKISDIIVKRMPPFFFKEALFAMYVENMLILESGSIGELIGNVMLKAVVDILVDFDVRIELLPDDSSKGIFEMEIEDVDEDMHDDDLEGDELHDIPSNLKKVRGSAYAEILDSLLILMFEHLKVCQESRRLNEVFEILLGSFETTVLSAYKSKFSQFVMFYACSLDPEGCGIRFAFILFNIFTNAREPPVKRMSAVAYLASYLSRAKFLPLPFVVEMLQRLVDWCFEYCENHDGDMNVLVHRVFYAGCQAMMYVLCFRMRSITESNYLKLQLRRMHIEAILKQPLDPIKVCLPSIVEEFLRQAEGAGLFKLLNGGVITDLDSEHSRAFGGKEMLDMFFPFDPCLLKKSDRYIRPHYIFWSMVKPIYDGDDEIEANSEDEEEDEDFIGRSTVIGDASMAGSYEEHDLDEFECSMNKMSITPRNNSLSSRFASERNGAMRMPSRIRPSTSPESL